MFKQSSNCVLAAAIAAASTTAFANADKQYDQLAEQMEALQAQMNQLQSADGMLTDAQMKGKPLAISGKILTEYLYVTNSSETRGDYGAGTKDYLEENKGDFRVAQIRLYMDGQSSHGVDYGVELRINNRSYGDGASIDTATIKNAWIGYGFDSGYLTAGRFGLPTAGGATNWSEGTIEYMAATTAVTDRTFDGFSYELSTGDAGSLTLYVGQAAGGDSIGEVLPEDQGDLGGKLFGATGKVNLSEGQTLGLGILSQEVVFADGDFNPEYDTEFAHALEAAYMAEMGAISTNVAVTYVIGDDMGYAAGKSGLATQDKDGNTVENWFIAHGHLVYNLGGPEEGWFNSPAVFVEGNYVFGGDIDNNDYGALVGFQHDIKDLISMSYEYSYTDYSKGSDAVDDDDDTTDGALFVRSTVKF